MPQRTEDFGNLVVYDVGNLSPKGEIKMHLRFGSSVIVKNAGALWVLILVATFMSYPTVFISSPRVFAADIEVYECKDPKLVELEKQVGPDFTVHDVYRFDFVNKSVSNRTLDDDGNDYEAGEIAVGQTTKYTAEFTMNGDNATWSHAMISDASGSATVKITFNVKTHKMHQTIVMTPKPGAANVPADATPLSVDSDLTCSVYSPKRKKG